MAASADDQDVIKRSSSYDTVASGALDRTLTSITFGPRRSAFSGYEVGNGLVRFNTSSIPNDAIVTSAVLRVRRGSFGYAWLYENNRSMRGEHYAWSGSADSDWQGDPLFGITAFEPVPISAFVHSYIDYDVPLVNVENINKDGYSSFRLHVTGGQPTGLNQLEFVAYDEPNEAEPRVRLIVTWEPASRLTLGSPSGKINAISGYSYRGSYSHPESLRSRLCTS